MISKIKKITAQIISIILGAAICAGVCVAAGCKTETETESVSIAAPEIRLTSTEISSSNFNKFDIPEGVQKAYTITAIVEPEDGTFQDLSWEVEFESDWDIGKLANGYPVPEVAENYVKVVPTEDTHTAVVECLKAFGAPIILTVSSKYNSAIKATCKLDYYARGRFTGFGLGGVVNGVEYDKDLTPEELITGYTDVGGVYYMGHDWNGKSKVATSIVGAYFDLSYGTIYPDVEVTARFEYTDEFYSLAEPYQKLYENNGEYEWSAEPGENKNKSFELIDGYFQFGDGTAKGYVTYANYYSCVPFTELAMCWAYDKSQIINSGYIEEFYDTVRGAFGEETELTVATITFRLSDRNGKISTLSGSIYIRIKAEDFLSEDLLNRENPENTINEVQDYESR